MTHRRRFQEIFRFLRQHGGYAGMLQLATIVLLAHGISAEEIRFDRDRPGSLPAGWTVTMTHTGGPPRWEVRLDDSAPHPPFVLAQVSHGSTAGGFRLHAVPAGRWNVLRVTFKDALFTVYLNGERLFDAEDRTFPQAGKAGLWTKADSQTYFNDFTIVKQ